MMKKFFSILMLSMVLTLTSCLDSGDPNYTTTTSIACYNRTQNLSDNTIKLKSAGYHVMQDLYNGTIAFIIQASFADDEEQVRLEIPAMPMTVDSQTASYKFSATEVIPTLNGKPSEKYQITDLKGRFMTYGTTLDGSYKEYAVLELSYIVNGQYIVNVANKKPLFIDCETTINSSTGTEPAFTTEKTCYQIIMNDTKTADIIFYQAQFAEKMPPMTIKLKEVPIKLTESGYTLEAANIVPYIGDAPNEAFKLSDFRMNFHNQTSWMALNFKCNALGKSYNATASGEVFVKTKSNQ